MSADVFHLSSGDLLSPTWIKLKKYMEARINTLHSRNDSDLNPIATARLRGEIASLKNLMAAAMPPSVVADDELG